jgi:ABC-type Mn2+/Zn2+ transport system ATPase subunit
VIQHARLQFKWQRRVLRKSRLDFAPGLNTLAGPNGSGKSTIIKALLQGTDCELQFKASPERRLFDTELMNPRVRSDPARTPAEMALRLRGSFSSHGQIIRHALATLPAGPHGMTLLIDEPEAGQDFAAVQRIKTLIDAACAQGYQFIVASHHPVFWFDTHLIELEPSYTRRVLAALAALH